MEDRWLLGIIFVVWAVLAMIYAVVPMFNMPGSAEVWGGGAVIFLILSLLNWRAETKTKDHPPQ